VPLLGGVQLLVEAALSVRKRDFSGTSISDFSNNICVEARAGIDAG
jgi:hypothetical protein